MLSTLQTQEPLHSQQLLHNIIWQQLHSMVECYVLVGLLQTFKLLELDNKVITNKLVDMEALYLVWPVFQRQ